MKPRTKASALRVLTLIDSRPETSSGRVLTNQLGRSGTAVGSNYRAAGRSRSSAEMISKFAVVEEEADESGFGLELVAEHGLMPGGKVTPFLREADERTAIMVASRRTLQAGLQKSKLENSKLKIG